MNGDRMSASDTDTAAALAQLSEVWRSRAEDSAEHNEVSAAIRAALDAGAGWPQIGVAMGYGATDEQEPPPHN